MDERIENNILAFAQVAHQQNQAYKAAIGQDVEGSWSQITPEKQQFIVNKVKYYLTNPNAVVSSLHDDWAYAQFKDGWTHGSEYDETKRTHPFLVSFSDLEVTRQVEDLMFMQTVFALSRLL